MNRVARGLIAVVLPAVLLTSLAVSPAPTRPPHSTGLTGHQQAVLRTIARDTWAFYRDDVDPTTYLPLDNLGPGDTRGSYTSAANVGVYLWAVVAAHDLHLISRRHAVSLIAATLRTVTSMKRAYGFVYQWYDTGTAAPIDNPGGTACANDPTAATDNCSFLSAVDNGWYASGLVVVRQAFPELYRLATRLVAPMDFSIFYDRSAQTECVADAAGQQYGGYRVGTGPATYHNSALYSDPRISMYMGLGLHQMPGDVWWRSWRTQPPAQCPGDPDGSGQGQPAQGHWSSIRDPQSGRAFRVWEGYYTYPGTNLRFVPTFAGGMFEGLMANEVVPETTWGPRGFGLADRRTAEVQIRYATEQLHYPVWGMSPSSTADDTGGYGAFGADGAALPPGQQLAQCPTCGAETTVTPHASFLALDVLPQAAYANIVRLRSQFPDSYSAHGGFYDAVDPTTGQVGHRRLVLDQSMIMAGLDNALEHRALQRHFAADPVARAAKAYLGAETMPLG